MTPTGFDAPGGPADEHALPGNDLRQPSPSSSPVAPAAALDPERMVDPTLHGNLLTNLHKATIDAENFGRSFLKILEDEIEPAIKDLSSCLLYPDSSTNEFDQCLQKFDTALQSMKNVQSNLQSSIEKARTVGEKVIKS